MSKKIDKHEDIYYQGNFINHDLFYKTLTGIMDDIMQHAIKERTATQFLENQRYKERWLALQSEHAQRERAIYAAKTRLQQLQLMAQQVQNGLQTTFEDASVDQKKLAIASRLAEQRLSQLRDDMRQTSESISVEKRLLDEMRTKLSAQDRRSVVELVLDATYKVYHICRTMRSRFEAATQAENMLRHMIHEQCLA